MVAAAALAIGACEGTAGQATTGDSGLHPTNDGAQGVDTAAPQGGRGGADEAVDAAVDAKPAVDLAADLATKVDVPAVVDVMGPEGGGDTPNTLPIAAGPWARGITVGLVEVTQGVFIKVGEGAEVVPAAMRNAPLVEGRPVYARVHVTTAASFVARQLRGVFTVEYPDKTSFQMEDKKMISASSTVAQLTSTFNFLFPAANIKPNATVSVAIYEGGAAEGADPATLPRFPATGGADLAVKEGKMELSVVIVPVGTTIMDTPERRLKLEKDIWDLYPVQKVNLRVRAPVTLMGTFSSTKGFAALRTAREMDNAKPHEYYHMVVVAPSAGYLGIGSVPGPTVNDASRRVAITILGNNNQTVDGSTNSTAHELGHNHGRSHAPGCGASGAEVTYPYKSIPGDMGTNGFSLSTNTLKPKAMFRELMSYCRPRWISDYQWGKFEARVRIVTAFPGAAMDRMMATRSLQGFAGPGETPDWGVVAGALVDPSVALAADRYALLTLADGRQVKVPVSVALLTDDQTQEFAVNLTGDDFSDLEVMQAEIFVDGRRSLVQVNSLQRLR